MALRFTCSQCGEVVVVKFLSRGEAAMCQACGSEVAVPEDAEEVEQSSSSAPTATYEGSMHRHFVAPEQERIGV